MSAAEWTARFGPAQDHATSEASAAPALDLQSAASPQAEDERKKAEHALKEQEQTEHREQVAHEKEQFVCYRQLYGDYSFWVRPLELFTGDVDRDGYSGPRFRRVA